MPTARELLEQVEKTVIYVDGRPAGHLGPRAFAALRAVLDLHRQHDSLDGTCVGCSEREDTYDDIPWPCPTVTAITAALEAS